MIEHLCNTDRTSDISSISGCTHMVTLIGNPTRHSLSPAMHNLSFVRAGVDAIYLCFDVADEVELPMVINALKCMEGWDGTNVTMPYKQAIMPLLTEIDDAAKLIGAVNVVRCRNGITTGFNCDGLVFLQSVLKRGVDLAGKKVTLIGCGGAGSAILVQAAFDGVAIIDVFEVAGSQGAQNVRDLIPKLAQKSTCSINLFTVDDMDALKASVETSDILVNASPVGMGRARNATPVPANFIKPGMVVADAIYYPKETQLLKDAAAKDCLTVSGVGMLLEQAAVTEKILYDVEMDTAYVEQELFADEV